MKSAACPLSVLALAAMSEHGWEPAVNWPLPEEPSIELLHEARRQVATYIDWYSNDAAPVTAPEEVRCEINRAAARLIEICLAIQQVAASQQ